MMKAIKIVKEDRPLGTGGAVKKSLKFLKNNFFILYGDSYLNFDLNKMLKEKKDKIKKSLTFLKNKAKTLEDIYNNSQYIINDEVNFNKEDLKLIDANAQKIISEFKDNIKEISNFTRENLEPVVQKLIKSNNTNFNFS